MVVPHGQCFAVINCFCAHVENERTNLMSAMVAQVPEKMTAIEAMMLEPLGVAIHAIDLAKVHFWYLVAHVSYI
eukprot:SAG31_NODE_16034_length_726_cov_1.244019_2_plen_74_part_00